MAFSGGHGRLATDADTDAEADADADAEAGPVFRSQAFPEKCRKRAKLEQEYDLKEKR